MKKLFITAALCHVLLSFSQQKFTDVSQLINYASQKSITLQENQIKINQAKKAKLAAVLNIIDPTGSSTMTFLNNTKLPVSVFPAEILGGTPGTFTEIQTGVQYTNTINQNIDIKIINLQGWENLKLAKLNIQLTESESQIDLKSLHESIATNYYNIVTLQEQLKSTRINEAVADSLYSVAANKYKLGLVRQQDVNDTKVSYINTKENANQMEFLLKNYLLSLKILCDIPDEELITIEDKSTLLETLPSPNAIENNLAIKNSVLNEKYALSNFKKSGKEFLPTLSLLAHIRGNYLTKNSKSLMVIGFIVNT